MNPTIRQNHRLVWVGIGLTLALVLLAFGLNGLRGHAPSEKPLPVYGQVADFNLTNQLGRRVSLADLRGHVWVTDVIFTRCPGPCLTMTRQMKELQLALAPSSTARLVTLTTDPTFDTPPVLNAYASRFAANTNRWMFLTGTKEQIRDLAVGSLKLTALDKKPEEQQSPTDLFVHSTIFVVVDKQGQVRGVFQTTGEDVDPKQTRAEILDAVRRLESDG
jgi:protein SCO1/2